MTVDAPEKTSESQIDPRVARSRAAILRATADLLIESGSAGVTIEGISERSRVAKTTIYRHWKSRSQLVFDAFESLFAPVVPVKPEGSIESQLRRTLWNLTRALTESEWAPAVSALIEASDRDPELRQLVHDFLLVRMENGREVIRAGKVSGELRADLDVNVAISMLVGPVFYRRLVSKEPLTLPFTEALVDQFLAGARTPTR
ncbi:MAG: TetR/AcrR family transcriptional regulator [Dehalococcoidia bacterium]